MRTESRANQRQDYGAHPAKRLGALSQCSRAGTHLTRPKWLRPPASSLQPPASSLQPPASSLQPPASSLQPPATGAARSKWLFRVGDARGKLGKAYPSNSL